MGRLTYTAIASLDGFVEDESGDFGWAMPDHEVHAFVNDLGRGVGTELYGRRMYETMAVWQTIGEDGPVSDVEADFAEQWRAQDKVVFSTTLDAVWTPRTTLERRFDPAAVERLKAERDHELAISGPGIAAHAFRAGLVDDVHLLLFPVVVGGGKPALPRGSVVRLELLEERRFGNGVVHLHHRVR